MKMKKSANILFCLSIAVISAFSLSGCKQNNDISGGNSETASAVSIPETTEATTETTPQTTETELTETTTAAETETTAAAENLTTETEKQSFEEIIVSGVELGFDIDGIEVFRGDYPLPDIREEFDKKLSEWREVNDIVGPYFDYAYIDGCTVISAFSGEFAGNTQTSHVIVDCGDKIIEIDAGDIINIKPIYFVGGGVLYCCDSSLSAGNERFVLTEFSLTSGEKLNEYSDIHSLGDTSDNYRTTNPNIGSVDELKSYILDISPRWYDMELMMWDGYVQVPNWRN